MVSDGARKRFGSIGQATGIRHGSMEHRHQISVDDGDERWRHIHLCFRIGRLVTIHTFSADFGFFSSTFVRNDGPGPLSEFTNLSDPWRSGLDVSGSGGS